MMGPIRRTLCKPLAQHAPTQESATPPAGTGDAKQAVLDELC